MKQIIRKIIIMISAFLVSIATGMDFAVQRKVLPDGVNIIDMLYQLIARTTTALSNDGIAKAVMFVVFLLLGNRYLFRKPKNFGLGEYILGIFLSFVMLLNRGIRSGDTIFILWENNFQIIKSVLYMGGMYILYLIAIRGLSDILERKPSTLIPGAIEVAVEKQTFWRIALVLFIIWLPQIIAKYPGVLMWDTYWQIHQFLGDAARTSNHPPLGTLLYGLTAKIGQMLGNVNITYALFTLGQVISLILVLSYSITVMKRFKVPYWIRIAAFVLYAVSPCYAGWATVICKDTTYLTLCILIGTLFIEFAHDKLSFLADWRKTVGLGACFVILWLTRYNGVLIVSVFFIAACIILFSQKGTRKLCLRLIAFALVTILVSIGSNEALIRILNITRIYMPDVLSIPFQQTALVVARHADAVSAADQDVINRLVDYSQLGKLAGTWRADPIKGTYKHTATSTDRSEYLMVWAKQLIRYPIDYLDALVLTNGAYIDIQYNHPMYISLADNSRYHYVYPYAYNDLSLYNSEELIPFDSAQRMITQWYFSFDDLPLIGLFSSMGFSANVMLILLYLAYVNKRRKAIWAFIPSILTFAGCLFSPLAYLRYALPYVCSVPILFASYCIAQQNADRVQEKTC